MDFLTIVIVVGITMLLTTGVVVGIMEAHQASVWREIARQRREQWERGQGPPDDYE